MTGIDRRGERTTPLPSRLVDVIVGATLSLGVLLVHPVHYMLRAPYWFDEQWVVVSTRVPLTKLPLVSCVSPIGFTFLIRLIPGTGLERHRLLVLLLAAGAVGAGYLVGRELRLVPPVTGMLVGGGVLLAPMFARVISLKPYMGDGFVTLTLFLLLTRLESRWTRGRLVALATAGTLFSLLSYGSLFVTPAVFGSLFIATAVRREWQRVVEVFVAGAIAAAGIAIVFALFVARHQNDSLRKFWSDYFIPTDTSAYEWSTRRFDDIAPFLGTRHVPVVVLMVLLGLATLLWLRRLALALATPLLVLIAMTASAAHRYPFLDLRTSIFWLVALVMLMGIGAAAVVALLARWRRVLGAIALVVIAIIWVQQARPFANEHTIKAEPLRAEVRYIDAHRQPDDIVLVSFPSLWGFAFYERSARVSVVRVPDPAVGFPDFEPTFPHNPDIVAARGREPRQVRAAFDAAGRLLEQREGARLWVVLSHTQKHEQRAWRAALAGTDAEFKIRTPGRFEGLLLLTRGPQE